MIRQANKVRTHMSSLQKLFRFSGASDEHTGSKKDKNVVMMDMEARSFERLEYKDWTLVLMDINGTLLYRKWLGYQQVHTLTHVHEHAHPHTCIHMHIRIHYYHCHTHAHAHTLLSLSCTYTYMHPHPHAFTFTPRATAPSHSGLIWPRSSRVYPMRLALWLASGREQHLRIKQNNWWHSCLPRE